MSRPSDPPWMHNDIRKFIRARKRLHNMLSTTIPPETGQNIEKREIFV